MGLQFSKRDGIENEIDRNLQKNNLYFLLIVWKCFFMHSKFAKSANRIPKKLIP
jgi:hypothetical protein